MQQHQRERVALLRQMHKEACFAQGDHPDEIDTAFSEGADAIQRLAAIDAKQSEIRGATQNERQQHGGRR